MMFKVRTFAISKFIHIWPYNQSTSLWCEQACKTRDRVSCEIFWFREQILWQFHSEKTSLVVFLLSVPNFMTFLSWKDRDNQVISEFIFKGWFSWQFFIKKSARMSFRDDLHGSICYNILGSHQVWKNLKTRWSDWVQTWSSLVSETSDWIISPTTDDAEINS